MTNKKTLKLNKKLNTLQRKEPRNMNHNINANYENLYKRIFNTEEDQIPKKGIKLVIEPTFNIQGYIAKIESAIQKINKKEQDIMRAIVFNKITKNRKLKNLPHCGYKTSKLIKQLKSDKDIVIIDSDKTKRLVVLDTDQYIKLMQATIEKMNYSIIEKDFPKLIRTRTKVKILLNQQSD